MCACVCVCHVIPPIPDARLHLKVHVGAPAGVTTDRKKEGQHRQSFFSLEMHLIEIPRFILSFMSTSHQKKRTRCSFDRYISLLYTRARCVCTACRIHLRSGQISNDNKTDGAFVS